MDYMEQIEKLYKYLELNLDLIKIDKVVELKRNFNNDLNLLGCFIKDFLTLENSGKISNDNNIYHDFVLCFEKYKDENKIKTFINKLVQYSQYYQILIYEDTSNRVLLNTIASVNSCYAMEYYPFLMELIDKYENKEIDSISYALMLQSITDTVFKYFENEADNNVSLQNLRDELNTIMNSQTSERLAI